jgi:hypothetical protein
MSPARYTSTNVIRLGDRSSAPIAPGEPMRMRMSSRAPGPNGSTAPVHSSTLKSA